MQSARTEAICEWCFPFVERLATFELVYQLYRGDLTLVLHP